VGAREAAAISATHRPGGERRRSWIVDRDEAPSGPLACLSNAVYPIDWSGLTTQKMRLTVKIRYAPADAGPQD
jgi:hypothetical protein